MERRSQSSGFSAPACNDAYGTGIRDTGSTLRDPGLDHLLDLGQMFGQVTLVAVGRARRSGRSPPHSRIGLLLGRRKHPLGDFDVLEWQGSLMRIALLGSHAPHGVPHAEVDLRAKEEAMKSTSPGNAGVEPRWKARRGLLEQLRAI